MIGRSHSTDTMVISSEIAFRSRDYRVHETETNLVFRLESCAQIYNGTCRDSKIGKNRKSETPLVPAQLSIATDRFAARTQDPGTSVLVAKETVASGTPVPISLLAVY